MVKEVCQFLLKVYIPFNTEEYQEELSSLIKKYHMFVYFLLISVFCC